MDRFNRNLQAGFGISLLVLLLSSMLSYYSINRLIYNSSMVDHTHRVLQESDEIIARVRDGETGQRGYLLTGQADFLSPYNGAFEKAIESVNSLRELTKDNESQLVTIDSLEQMINKRFSILAISIDSKRAGDTTDVDLLRSGHAYMQSVRSLVGRIQNHEQALLAERTSNLRQFVNVTPYVILAAAVISILITVIFFRRVVAEFSQKRDLANSLALAEEDMLNRINIIESVAGKIAGGDYSIRVHANQHDQLGSLAGSLNRMAGSLETVFTDLQRREWQQSGVASLSEAISGEKTVQEIAADGIQFICDYTGSQVGAIYIADTHESLYVAGDYALPLEVKKSRLRKKEGLAGQCWANKQLLHVAPIDEKLFTPAMGGVLRPKQLLLVPIMFEKNVIGVIEIGTVQEYTEQHSKFMISISDILGVTLHTAQNRSKLKELLEETQAQAEELQSQHRELENINAELEAQTERLQTSEEELKVQQEELQEANQGLEERSMLLEDKNHQIVLRNLEIQKKAEELALSTRYKSEFLANMSHELRTPLNSVLLLSRLLGENPAGNLTPDQVEYAQVIQSSGNGLLQLIDEILDLSKIEAGKLELEYERIQVSDIVAQMRQLFGPMAAEKNLAIEFKIDPAVPQSIETDRLRVEQVLKNLLSNALKFTHSGKIVLEVQQAQKQNCIAFAVQDSGIGIPEDKHQLVFEAFQQADGSTKRKFGGTGLGLSISRELARLLGGEIELESEPGEGSRFTLIVPIFRQAVEVISAPRETINPVPEVVNPVANRLVSAHIPQALDDDRDQIEPGDKVLFIVEDDTNFAKALIDFSRGKGYRVLHVVRGDEVLEHAIQYQPVGILLDIQLPVKDGLSVLDELKQHIRTRHIPVHILSSFEARKESISRGAIDFINKPVAYEQMNAVLEKIERIVNSDNKQVLIVEDNTKHARALEYFLRSYNVQSKVCTDIQDGINSLSEGQVNCVILDLGSPAKQTYQMLDEIKKEWFVR
ncbi:MAG: CHASE3 domain-containing protein [Chitinophagaceae bacterium]|nr:CHASE3 domain-containing protein [Chitinophagaceae bacterium]